MSIPKRRVPLVVGLVARHRCPHREVRRNRICRDGSDRRQRDLAAVAAERADRALHDVDRGGAVAPDNHDRDRARRPVRRTIEKVEVTDHEVRESDSGDPERQDRYDDLVSRT